jgi:hypothetical protein
MLVRVLVTRPDDRIRALALLGFLASVAGIAFFVAWSRACLGSQAALGCRFTVLASPVLCAVFFTVQLCGPRRLAVGCQGVLLALVLLTLPTNIDQALESGRNMRTRTHRFLANMEKGLEPDELANRSRILHIFHPPEDLAEALRMLDDAAAGPFDPDFRASLPQVPRHAVANHRAKAAGSTLRR